MLTSRYLSIALLISFIWHLFWLSFITIVFLPGKFKPSRYSSVCFLGSILRSPISVHPSCSKLQAVIATKNLEWGGPVDKYEVPSEVESQPNLSHFIQGAGVGFRKNGGTAFAPERENLNPDSFIDVDEPIGKIFPAATFVSAKTTAQQRELLYQPPLFRYPEWTQQELKAEFVTFRIYISAKGLVEQVINVQASGNPEIDAALARYIERWRFAPASGPQGQWQTVEINTDWHR